MSAGDLQISFHVVIYIAIYVMTWWMCIGYITTNDCQQFIIISEGGQDTSAYRISSHSRYASSIKCPEACRDGQTLANVVSIRIYRWEHLSWHFTHGCSDWLLGWLFGWLISWCAECFYWLYDDWLTDWPTVCDWFIYWFTDWLTDWLIDSSIHSSQRGLTRSIASPGQEGSIYTRVGNTASSRLLSKVVGDLQPFHGDIWEYQKEIKTHSSSQHTIMK